MRFFDILKNKLCVFILLSIFIFSYIQAEELDNYEKSRIKKWKKDLAEYKAPDNSKKLKYLYSFPSEENGDVYFKSVQNMCFDNNGNVLVTDTKKHKIYKFDEKGKLLQTIGRKGKGPGNFYGLTFIQVNKNNNMIVCDSGNSRIQTLNFNGNYIRSFRVFNPVMSMINISDELLSLRFINKHKDLLYILNDKGSVVKKIGEDKYHSDSSNNWMHRGAFFAYNDRGIYVAYKFFPLIRRYSTNGNLLNEFNITNSKVEDAVIFNNNNKFKKNAPIKLINSGMYPGKSGIYILSYYPRIEIYNYSDKGDLLETFWTDQEYNFIGRNILIKESEKMTLFYILQLFPENRIDIYSAE